jgi:hypothetical protein
MLRPRLLAAAALLFAAGALRADQAPPSPLRLVPAEADFIVHVPGPAKAAKTLLSLDLLEQLQKFAAAKEQLDGTAARRGRQLLAYVERKLGDKWPALLDKLAGGGLVLATKVGGNNAPALLVAQARDEEALKKAVPVLVALIESELERQESKEKLVKVTEQGVEGYKVGSAFFMARAGGALVVSNKKDAIQAALKLHLGKSKKSLADDASYREANMLLPEGPLATVWLNMRPIQKSPQGKALYKMPRDDFLQTLVLGGFLGIAGQTPSFAGGLYAKKDGFELTFRAPRGRDGMGGDAELHVAPGGKATCRPLLEPKGVLYSSTFYYNFPAIWTEREKIFPKGIVEQFTKFEKTSGRQLGGVKISALLESLGSSHRFVAATSRSSPYKTAPNQKVPAFAFIPEMSKPDRFARNIDTLLRFAALAASTQLGMKLDEAKHGGVEIVAYRFDEKAKVSADAENIRFNFTPCFARVGDQMVFSSTLELCKELIDLLQQEQKSAKESQGQSAKVRPRDRYYSTGLAGLAEDFQETLLAQTILDQAVPAKEAKQEVGAIIKLLRGLGTLTTSSTFEAKQFRYDLVFKKGK